MPINGRVIHESQTKQLNEINAAKLFLQNKNLKWAIFCVCDRIHFLFHIQWPALARLFTAQQKPHIKRIRPSREGPVEEKKNENNNKIQMDVLRPKALTSNRVDDRRNAIEQRQTRVCVIIISVFRIIIMKAMQNPLQDE